MTQLVTTPATLANPREPQSYTTAAISGRVLSSGTAVMDHPPTHGVSPETSARAVMVSWILIMVLIAIAAWAAYMQSIA